MKRSDLMIGSSNSITTHDEFDKSKSRKVPSTEDNHQLVDKYEKGRQLCFVPSEADDIGSVSLPSGRPRALFQLRRLIIEAKKRPRVSSPRRNPAVMRSANRWINDSIDKNAK
jgi:hypothetical protein